MKLYLITDSIDTYEGLRMTGVEGIVVHEDEEIAPAISKATSDPDIGILLITERLAAKCQAQLSPYKMSAVTPLVVEIPDRHSTGRAGDSITRYIKEAIGVDL